MVVVHIHGATQCTEVRAESVEKALWAYVANSTCWLCDWYGTQIQYAEDDKTILRMVAEFATEECTIVAIPDTTNVFYAKWEGM